MKRNKLILLLALTLITLLGGLTLRAKPAEARVRDCPNTECNYVTLCRYAAGVQCKISGSAGPCTNTLCAT